MSSIKYFNDLHNSFIRFYQKGKTIGTLNIRTKVVGTVMSHRISKVGT